MKIILIMGLPGAGKTTLMLTMADSMTKKGAIVLFNTAEESLYQTAMTAKRLNLKNGFRCGNDFKPFVFGNSDRFAAFVKADDDVASTFLEIQGMSVSLGAEPKHCQSFVLEDIEVCVLVRVYFCWHFISAFVVRYLLRMIKKLFKLAARQPCRCGSGRGFQTGSSGR